jgi:hypothetical protein
MRLKYSGQDSWYYRKLGMKSLPAFGESADVTRMRCLRHKSTLLGLMQVEPVSQYQSHKVASIVLVQRGNRSCNHDVYIVVEPTPLIRRTVGLWLRHDLRSCALAYSPITDNRGRGIALLTQNSSSSISWRQFISRS